MVPPFRINFQIETIIEWVITGIKSIQESTQCNQLMTGQDHCILPMKIHGRYSPHQQQLQPAALTINYLDETIDGQKASILCSQSLSCNNPN